MHLLEGGCGRGRKGSGERLGFFLSCGGRGWEAYLGQVVWHVHRLFTSYILYMEMLWASIRIGHQARKMCATRAAGWDGPAGPATPRERVVSFLCENAGSGADSGGDGRSMSSALRKNMCLMWCRRVSDFRTPTMVYCTTFSSTLRNSPTS